MAPDFHLAFNTILRLHLQKDLAVSGGDHDKFKIVVQLILVLSIFI